MNRLGLPPAGIVLAVASTVPPPRRRRFTMASPIPLVPPVTSIRLPVNSFASHGTLASLMIWSSRSKDSFRDGEHDAKSGFAAYHALVSLADPFQWEHFIHRFNAGKHTEFQRLLGINCSPRIHANN